MDATTITPQTIARLNELFTRMFISAGTYVFEAQPYTLPADKPLVAQLEAVKAQDLDHATLLASLLRSQDLVPEPGVFPYWHRDLNYLTLPFLAAFVAESLETDLGLLDAALAENPDPETPVHTVLRVMRDDRARLHGALAPAAQEALAREAQQYADEARAIRETREARVAKQKAAAAAAKDAELKKKAAAKAEAAAAAAASAPPAGDPTAGMPDPNEPGISSKEKAKRTMMIRRAQKAAASAAPAAAAADATAGMPDPNEPGISSKEKAKRTMMIKRAQKAAASAAPAAAAADPTAGMPDPNEPGISSKEKAKRTMMIRRAQKAAETAPATESAPAAPAAPAPADPTAGMPDPSEPGISSKEKAKRTMMIRRAQKAAEAAQAESAPAEPKAPAQAGAAPAASLEDTLAAMPDPDEPGISGKEKAKRTVMRNRAKKKFEDGAAD